MGGLAKGVSDVLGVGSGQGSDFRAQGSPVSQAQLDASNARSASALDQQQQLAQLLAGQGGLQNQQSVFNQQQQLANALALQAQGGGPNPALAQLNNATGQNVANQAALMAGQRGSSANAGLMARQAAMQGAGLQQQAVGQGAAMQAQQQLNAQQQLAAQQAAMQGVAANQVGNQIGLQNTYTGNVLGQQSNLLGNQVNAISNQNTTNAGVAAENAKNQAKLSGGIIQGVGNAAMLALAKGGMVKNPDHIDHAAECYGHTYSHGGMVNAMVSPGEKYLDPEEAEAVAEGEESIDEAGKKFKGKAAVKGDSQKNDVIPTKLEEGGVVIPRSKMDDPEEAVKFLKEALKKHGKKGSEESDFKSALKKAVEKGK